MPQQKSRYLPTAEANFKRWIQCKPWGFLVYSQGRKINRSYSQGGLNKKEIQLNICNTFFILTINELFLSA